MKSFIIGLPQRAVMLTAFYLLCTMAYGFDITIDGINYSVDTSTGTAKVVCVSNPELELYDSYLTIPSSIEYVGNNYLVTSIGSRAFDNLQNLKAVTISDGIFVLPSWPVLSRHRNES